MKTSLLLVLLFVLSTCSLKKKVRRMKKVKGFRFKQQHKKQDFEDILKDFNGDSSSSNNMEEL